MQGIDFVTNVDTEELEAAHAGMWASVRRHRLALFVMLLGVGVGQAGVLIQKPFVNVKDDSFGYLSVAHAILNAHNFFDPTRTPGYPIFLAFIFALFGSRHLGIVTVFQAALMVVTAFELYMLVYNMSRRRWLACITAILIGGNFYVLNWERVIRVEAFTYWSLVTLFLAFERYLRKRSRTALFLLTLIGTWTILIRPNNVFIPLLLFVLLAVRDFRLGVLRVRWKPYALASAVIYAVIVAYMAANAVSTGYFGVTDVTNVNLFGKILEYGMQGESGGQAYPSIQHDAVTWANAPGSRTIYGELIPWAFLNKYPEDGQDHYQRLGAFSESIILHHPVQYLRDTWPDLIASWHDYPWSLYAPYSVTTGPVSLLFKLSDVTYGMLAMLPLLLVVFLLAVWQHPEHDAAFLSMALMLTALAGIVLNALASYDEFFRLRSPLDWMVMLVGILLVAEVIARVSGKRLHVLPLA